MIACRKPGLHRFAAADGASETLAPAAPPPSARHAKAATSTRVTRQLIVLPPRCRATGGGDLAFRRRRHGAATVASAVSKNTFIRELLHLEGARTKTLAAPREQNIRQLTDFSRRIHPYDRPNVELKIRFENVDPPAGSIVLGREAQVGVSVDSPIRFTGWLGLLQALERLLDGARPSFDHRNAR